MLLSGVVRGWGVVTYASQWCCERVGVVTYACQWCYEGVVSFAGGHICPRPGSPSRPSGGTLVLCSYQFWQETDPVLRLLTGLQCSVSECTQVLLRAH